MADSFSLRSNAKEKISVTGLAFWNKKNYVLAVSKGTNSLYICDLKAKKVITTVNLSSECYDVIIDNQEKYAYVSLWGDSAVYKINFRGHES